MSARNYILNPCWTLNVDPARISGVSCFVRGTYLWHATVDVADVQTLDGHVRRALRDAIADNSTLVLVGEKWGEFGEKGHRMRGGITAGWLQWEWSLTKRVWPALRAELGIKSPAPKVAKRVNTSTWRSAIYRRRVHKDDAKELAIRTVWERHRIRLAPEEHNAAEAILIGDFSAYWPMVAKVLPQSAWRARA